jgi:hypothetical protein
MALGNESQLLRRAGFADAGLTGDKNNAATSCPNLLERTAQRFQFPQSSDEFAGRRCHLASPVGLAYRNS